MKQGMAWVLTGFLGVCGVSSPAWATNPACEELPLLIDEMLANTQSKIASFQKEDAMLSFAGEREGKAANAFVEEVIQDFDHGVIAALSRAISRKEALFDYEKPEVARFGVQLSRESDAFWSAYKNYGGAEHQAWLRGARLEGESQKKALVQGRLALFRARKLGLGQRKKELTQLCRSVSPERGSTKVSNAKTKEKLSPEAVRLLQDEGSLGGTEEGAALRKKYGVGAARD